MPYIAASQIYAKIPQSKVNDALDDDNTGDATLIATNLANVITNACNAVDAALAGRYPVPFGNPPAFVIEASLIFACEDLYSRREVNDDQNPFKKQAKEYRARLERIRAREEALDLTVQEVSGAMIGGPAVIKSRLSNNPTIGP